MTVERIVVLKGRDRDAILDVWVLGWSKLLPGVDFVSQRDWFSTYLDDLMEGGAWLLVTRTPGDDAPIGFLTVHPGTGTMNQLAVHPAHTGRGLARALIGQAKSVSPGGLDLRVNKLNTRAIALYRRAGFAVTGEDVSARSGLPVWTMAWRTEAPC